jgi:hypothetical protein
MTKGNKIAMVALSFVCVLGGIVSTVSAKPLFQEKPLYIAGMDGVRIYRIPSIIVTQQGTILALCEAREGGDKSPTDLVLKRSNDFGRTWGPMELVLEGKPGAIMNVKLSYDEGQTWPVSKTIHSGPSAYCCLTVLPDGTVGLLYEGGQRGRYDSILFARVNLEWLTDGQDILPTDEISEDRDLQ